MYRREFYILGANSFLFYHSTKFFKILNAYKGIKKLKKKGKKYEKRVLIKPN